MMTHHLSRRSKNSGFVQGIIIGASVDGFQMTIDVRWSVVIRCGALEHISFESWLLSMQCIVLSWIHSKMTY